MTPDFKNLARYRIREHLKSQGTDEEQAAETAAEYCDEGAEVMHAAFDASVVTGEAAFDQALDKLSEWIEGEF